MGTEGTEPFDAFDAIADELSELRLEAVSEQLGEAREILAAGTATRSFADELRRIAPGDVVTVFTTDGDALRGRILSIGPDWLRVGEVADDTGSRRARLLRLHDVRLAAVARVTREAVQ